MSKLQQVKDLVGLGYYPHYCERYIEYWPEDINRETPLVQFQITFTEINDGLLVLRWQNIESRMDIDMTDDEWEGISAYCHGFATID